jgi:hypothetical protein
MENREMCFTRFDSLENSIVLQIRLKEKLEIFIPEINKIYLSVYVVPPIQKFLIVLLSALVFIITILFLSYELFLVIPLLVFVLMLMKMINCKRYTLFIRLENGMVYKKKIAVKFRPETIDFLNSVRKKMYVYRIEKRESS